MNKKFLLTLFIIFISSISVQAYEDCIIFNKYKLTDINIEDNSIIDVCPLVTVNNDKNILIVHPVKSGKTRFCVLKNNKNLALFEVEVNDYKTEIKAPDGFEVLALDTPFDDIDFKLDMPPGVK